MGVAGGHVNSTRPVSAGKGEAGVNTWCVDECKAQGSGSVEMGGGILLCCRGEESGGVRRTVGDVGVACD